MDTIRYMERAHTHRDSGGNHRVNCLLWRYTARKAAKGGKATRRCGEQSNALSIKLKVPTPFCGIPAQLDCVLRPVSCQQTLRCLAAHPSNSLSCRFDGARGHTGIWQRRRWRGLFGQGAWSTHTRSLAHVLMCHSLQLFYAPSSLRPH